MRLFEFPQAIDTFLESLEIEGGEVTPEWAEAMDSLFADLDAKARGVVGAIRHYQALETAAAAEAARLREVQRRFQGKVDRLKQYLLEAMRREEIDRVVTAIGGVSRCKSGTPSIRWEPLREPPDGYFRLKPAEVVLDREAILDAHQHGFLPEGFVVEYTEHLRIK